MTVPLLLRPLGIREADVREPAEAARIDRFVHDHGRGTPFHLTGWARAVARGCGQRSRYLVAETGGGAIAGVLPLTEMRHPLFGRALVSAGFAVDGGVLGEGVEALTAGAWALAERLGIGAVELRGGVAPDGWRVTRDSHIGFMRPLAADEASELQAIPRKQRAEVRRALTLDLDVAVGGDPREHYRVYSESVRNLGTPVFPRALFAAVLDEMDADILTVRHQGRAVASVLSLYHRGTVYPYWGGGTAAARGLRANDRMYFALMNHARGRGCTRFDFGRSKVGTGAAAFKKNWGFAPAPLSYASRAEGEAREINPLDPRYAARIAAWKRLPLPVANLVGPWLARGLG